MRVLYNNLLVCFNRHLFWCWCWYIHCNNLHFCYHCRTHWYCEHIHFSPQGFKSILLLPSHYFLIFFHLIISNIIFNAKIYLCGCFDLVCFGLGWAGLGWIELGWAGFCSICFAVVSYFAETFLPYCFVGFFTLISFVMTAHRNFGWQSNSERYSLHYYF